MNKSLGHQKMKWTIIYALLFVFCSLEAFSLVPRNVNACGDKSSYEDHNQIEPKPLRLAKLQGRGVIEIRGRIKPDEPVSGACLVLFTNDQKFVSGVKANADGEFQFGGIAPGHYRLIARAQGLCTANIPIEIVKAPRWSKLQNVEIVVHYRVSEIDTCSWGGTGKRVARRHQ